MPKLRSVDGACAPTLRTVPPSVLEQQADAALKVADDRPRRALVMARSVRERAADAGDHRAASAATRAVGLAHLHLHDVDHAVTALTSAVREAQTASASELEGRARMTLAAALSQSGRLDEALREADRAVAALDGLDQARACAQRGLVQTYLGDREGALESFAEAEPVLRGRRDEDHLLSALLNRGALELHHGDVTSAARDLGEAIVLAETLGRDLQAGYAHANLGLVFVERGEVLAALDHLTAAEGAIRRRGGAVGPLLTIRGELLLSVRLLTEARQAAMAGLRAATRNHDPVSAADARVLLAQITMLERRPVEA